MIILLFTQSCKVFHNADIYLYNDANKRSETLELGVLFCSVVWVSGLSDGKGATYCPKKKLQIDSVPVPQVLLDL